MADKKYFRITAGMECEKDFYVQAQDKEEALEELDKLNFQKEETVPFSGKIEVDVVDKEQDIVEVTEEEAQPKDVIQSIKEVMEEQGFALVSCGQGLNGAQGYAFMHRQTGEYIGVQEEELDEELDEEEDDWEDDEEFEDEEDDEGLEGEEGGDLETGSEITVAMFSDGQAVDVSGTSIGKGFAGTIKRHHFRSQDASHGNSLSHRAPGSIGQNQTPGRVFKGKKMAGQMGDERVTSQNLEIVRVDAERNLLLIKGAVPGAAGGTVMVRPSSKAVQ